MQKLGTGLVPLSAQLRVFGSSAQSAGFKIVGSVATLPNGALKITVSECTFAHNTAKNKWHMPLPD